MKLFLDFGWLAGWKPGGGILCLILVLAVGGGCGKSKSTPPPVASSPASNSTPTVAVPTATPPSGPAPPPVPSSSANSSVTQLQSLNRVLLGWVMEHHRRPQTFEEFASTAHFQIPDPPAGQKYALTQKGFIVLVNETQ